MSTTTSNRPDEQATLRFRFARKSDHFGLCRLVRRHGSEDFYCDEQVESLLDFSRPPGIVVTHGRNLLGCVTWLPRTEDLDYEILLAVIVHKDYRRRHIGRSLLKALWKRPTAQLPSRILAPVRESDLESQLFLKGSGYRCKDVVEGVFNQPPETGYLFETYQPH